MEGIKFALLPEGAKRYTRATSHLAIEMLNVCTASHM